MTKLAAVEGGPFRGVSAGVLMISGTDQVKTEVKTEVKSEIKTEVKQEIKQEIKQESADKQ